HRDQRHGVAPEKVDAGISADRKREIKAVMVVHSETATGTASRITDIRRAIDDIAHPALFMVDAVSSLGAMEYQHDAWGIDVTISGSQKGLMLPHGLGLHAVVHKGVALSI